MSSNFARRSSVWVTDRALLGDVAVVKSHVPAAAETRPRLLQRLKQELDQPCVHALVRLDALPLRVLLRSVDFQVEERGRCEYQICAEILWR